MPLLQKSSKGVAGPLQDAKCKREVNHSSGGGEAGDGGRDGASRGHSRARICRKDVLGWVYSQQICQE